MLQRHTIASLAKPIRACATWAMLGFAAYAGTMTNASASVVSTESVWPVELRTSPLPPGKGGKKNAVLTIRSSIQCEMCVDRIQTGLKAVKGVKKVSGNLNDHSVTVHYQPSKTNPDAIRKALAALGYDADDVKADAKAYAALPGCCQKPR